MPPRYFMSAQVQYPNDKIGVDGIEYPTIGENIRNSGTNIKPKTVFGVNFNFYSDIYQINVDTGKVSNLTSRGKRQLEFKLSDDKLSLTLMNKGGTILSCDILTSTANNVVLGCKKTKFEGQSRNTDLGVLIETSVEMTDTIMLCYVVLGIR